MENILKNKRLWLLVALVVVLFLSFKFLPEKCACNPGLKKEVITIGTTHLTVEVADTDRSREQGLSGREGLDTDTGMLFVFDQPGNYGFWMKDMKFDLDIIWLDASSTVLGISEGVKADSYPQVFSPPSVSMYVLEVPSGFSDAHSITVSKKLLVNG